MNYKIWTSIKMSLRKQGDSTTKVIWEIGETWLKGKIADDVFPSDQKTSPAQSCSSQS